MRREPGPRPFRLGPGLLLAAALITMAVLAGTAFSPTSARAQVPIDDATLARVEEYLEMQRLDLGLPGMAVGIVQGDEVLLLRGFGEADIGGAPVRPETPFLLASVSKSMTALATVQLVEDGRVDLDAPVTTYLPELAPGGDAVTVRDLMHHRSGVSNFTGLESFVEPIASSLDANVARLGPDLEAGAPYEYSNANYDTMALIVERVSGLAYADYMDQNVFGPLGMDETFIDPALAADAGLAGGHYHSLLLGYRGFTPPMPSAMAGSYTTFSSAEDLTHLMIAHLNEGVYLGNRVATSDSIETLHQPRVYGPDTFPVGYAGGWNVFPPNLPGADEQWASYTVLQHDGSSEGYRSIINMTLGADVGIVLLANGNDVTNEWFIHQTVSNVARILFGAEVQEIMRFDDFLLQWGKHLLLVIVVAQVSLALLTLGPIRRIRRSEQVGGWGWAALGAASVVDLVALVFLLYVLPSTAEAPMSLVLGLPDLRVLVIAMAIGVTWGVIRTALVGTALVRNRSTRAEPVSG